MPRQPTIRDFQRLLSRVERLEKQLAQTRTVVALLQRHNIVRLRLWTPMPVGDAND